MNGPGLAYRADLQGLRAVAILLVVAAHAGVPWLAGGFVGVDVFFVLSGFLITGLLVQEWRRDGRIRFARFVARRLRRLLPALLAMLAVTLALASVLLSGHEFSEQTGSAAFAASWTANLYFAFSAADYFAELQQRDLYLHTWSLGVEEQFYLVWPVLLSAGFAWLGSSVSRRRLLIAACALALAGFALSLWWTAARPLWAFYLMPARVWQFALGAVVFFALVERQPGGAAPAPLPAALRRAAASLGLALVLGSALWLKPEMSYPGGWALLPSIGAALLIAAGCGVGRDVALPLGHPLLVWVGDRSYSWYLWHWPLLMLGFAWGLAEHPSAVAALVALALVFAATSYRYVELPFWKGRFSGLSARAALAAGVIAIAAMLPVPGQLSAWRYDHADHAAWLARAARDDMPVLYRPGCDTWFRSAVVQPCVFGNPQGRHTAVLIGDSVGAQWYGLLPAVLGVEWRFVVLTKSACAMVDEPYNYDLAGGEYKVCAAWRNAALDYLDTLSPDLLWVGSASTYDFSPAQWIEGSRRVFERLARASGQVLVLAGTPLLSFDGPGCLERHLATGVDPAAVAGACSEPLAGKPAAQVTGLLARGAAGLDNVQLLDLNDLVCPSGQCTAIDPAGRAVYRDSRHLTDSFVRAQASAVAARLQASGSIPGH